MRARLGWLLAVALGATALASALRRPAPDPGLGERLARTEAELAALKRDRPSVQTREVVRHVTTVAAPEQPEPSISAPDEVEAVTRAAETLEIEGQDPAWSHAAERELQSAYDSSEIEGTRLGELRCGASRCRMTFRHDGEAAVTSFRENVARLNPFPESSVLVQLGDGANRESVVFVARSGESLLARL